MNHLKFFNENDFSWLGEEKRTAESLRLSERHRYSVFRCPHGNSTFSWRQYSQARGEKQSNFNKMQCIIARGMIPRAI